MAQEVVGGRDLAQPPVDDHADAVGERGRVAEVVGHDDRREPQLGEQVLQVGAHARARVRVERRQRLVEQQDAGVAGERAGERGALALAARDLPGLRVGEVGDPEALEQRVDALAAPRRRRRSSRTVMCGNSAYSWKTRPDGPFLGRAVHARGRVEPHVVPERDPAAVRPPQARDRAQDGALAGARRADEGDRLRADGQADGELVRPKSAGDVELERLHDDSSL